MTSWPRREAASLPSSPGGISSPPTASTRRSLYLAKGPGLWDQSGPPAGACARGPGGAAGVAPPPLSAEKGLDSFLRSFGDAAPKIVPNQKGGASKVPPFSSILLLVQLEDSQESLRGPLHSSPDSASSSCPPRKGLRLPGDPSLILHARANECPCAKVFASGENACTALPRRPAPRGPEGKAKMLPPPPTRPA